MDLLEQTIVFSGLRVIFPQLEAHHNMFVLISLVLLLTILLLCLFCRKSGAKAIGISMESIPIVSRFGKPRFRKRDKIRFYATRLGRKFQNLTEQISKVKSKDEKQRFITKFARKLLSKPEQMPTLVKRKLPEFFFEAEIDDEDNASIPDEFKLIISSIRVFGHLEKQFFLEICRHVETICLEAGQHLFTVGESDENIYVLRTGKVRVYIKNSDNSEETIHEVCKGGNIHSILSVLDVITGNVQPYKTVQAVAVCYSEVLKLPARAFNDIFKRFPETMIRIIQVIAVRLQRVTFLAMHNYLGLSDELLSQENQTLPDSAVVAYHALHSSPKAPEGSNEFATNQRHPSTGSDAGDEIGPLRETHGHARDLSRHRRANNARASLDFGGPVIARRQVRQDIKYFSMIGKHITSLDSGSPYIGLAENTAGSTGRSRSQSPSGLLSRQLSNPEYEDLMDVENIVDVDPSQEKLELGVAPGNIPTETVAEERINRISFKRRRRDRASSSLIDENSAALLEAAKKDIINLLNIEDPTFLEGQLALMPVPAGSILVKEGDHNGNLYFVASGELFMLQKVVGEDPPKYRHIFTVTPGELSNIISILTGEPCFFTIRAQQDTLVVTITRQVFYSLLRAQPNVVLNLSNLMSRRMSSFLRQIDFALEWTSIKAGRSLYKQGDISDMVYIVLNGRLRQVTITRSGEKEVVSELGRGELVGFLEVLSNTPRATSVIAIRDSEVAQIPADLLSMIKRKAPQVVSRLIQLLSDRLLGNLTGVTPSPGVGITSGGGIARSTLANLRAVAVLPSGTGVNVEAFTLELQHAMGPIGSTVRLTSAIVLKRLGNKILDTMYEYRLASWLSQQEDQHRLIFYVCDPHPQSAWTKRCLRQADCVLVLAQAKGDPKLSSMESAVESNQTKVTKILVLIHTEDTDYPSSGGTASWLNNRPWVKQHFHIRCPSRVFLPRSSERLVSLYKRVFEREAPKPHSDMSRLARHLTGNSVGLVLGGGGARGISHAGVIRAFQEVGIPIDVVGGTSIGSFIGALWAEETKVTRFTQRAREFCKDMGCLWKKVFDITYPSVSMFSGRAFNRALETIFHDRQIEDLWIPYFCITTDISNSKMRVHTHGSVWRFVRASMSLSGYLPPLCDPHDGSLLLDGGYVNNVPADVMHGLGVATIFAVDVGSHDDTDLYNYGDELSGWWLLYNRFLRRDIRVPNLTEIQSRLAYVSCVRQLEAVKESSICEYLRPPIEKYATLQFSSFEEILDVGYKYTLEKIIEWRKKGLLETLVCSAADRARHKSNTSQVALAERKSSTIDDQRQFVDLAELVSRIDTKNSFVMDGDDVLLDDSDDSDAIYEDEDEGEGDEEETEGDEKQNTAGNEEEDPMETASDPEMFDEFLHSADRRVRHRRASMGSKHKRVSFNDHQRCSLDDLTKI